jgi:hypothetical protein
MSSGALIGHDDHLCRRAGIHLIVAQVPMLADVPGGQMLDDVTYDSDRAAPIGQRLSNMRLCAVACETVVWGSDSSQKGWTFYMYIPSRERPLTQLIELLGTVARMGPRPRRAIQGWADVKPHGQNSRTAGFCVSCSTDAAFFYDSIPLGSQHAFMRRAQPPSSRPSFRDPRVAVPQPSDLRAYIKSYRPVNALDVSVCNITAFMAGGSDLLQPSAIAYCFQ